MRRTLGRFTIATVLAVAASAVFAGASFGAPCWQQVVEDWYDNSRVDSTYPISCYQQALANLPEDMRAYSSAPDDIALARDDALRESASATGGGGGGSGGGGSGGGGSGGGGSGGGGSGGSPQGPGGTSMSGAGGENSSDAGEETGNGTDADIGVAPESGGVLREALDRVGPADASSLPIPLLMLGAVALLLVTAGAIALLARRLRGAKLPRDTA